MTRPLRSCLSVFMLLLCAAPLMGQEKAGKTQLVPVISLSGAYTESPQSKDNPFAAGKVTSFRSTLDKLRKIEKDPEVAAVILLFDGGIGSAQLEEVRKAVVAIKEAGKPVYSHADSLSMGSLALLSSASHLSVTPTGDLFINGMYAESPYLAGLLEKLDVQAEFLTCGAYKSAGEMFTNKRPSKAAKENEDWLIDGMFEERLAMIAKGRGVTVDQARDWIDDGLFSAGSAAKAGGDRRGAASFGLCRHDSR